MRVLHVGDDFAALRPCGLTLYSDALMRERFDDACVLALDQSERGECGPIAPASKHAEARVRRAIVDHNELEFG